MFIKFLKDCRASVAPILAISIIPLIGSVGLAVDYTRASAARTAFQSALDSTALLLSKTAATTPTDDALSSAATAYVTAMFNRPDTTNVSVHAHYSTDGGSKVTVTGTATVNTNFVRIFGFDQIDIGTSTTSTWGNTRLRVALVLDNTGSMSETGSNSTVTKMAALKTASHNLLAQLQTAASNSPDNVYVSIIPFSKDVNVKDFYANTPNAPTPDDTYTHDWLRWDLWDAVNGTCSDSSYHKQSSCLSHSKVWTPAAHSTWNGCVTDRDQNFDTTNDAPGAGATLYPTEQYASCPASVLQLTNDWTKLSDKVNAMTPNGNTNQAIGLQMGWQSLTASPFTVPAMDPNYNYKQVIILLTDGLNTQDRWYTTASSIDTRQQRTCDNVKAAGITIYAVQVNTGSDPVSTLLQNCASDPGKFYYLTSTSQIGTAFNQIGTAISNLRLAQ